MKLTFFLYDFQNVFPLSFLIYSLVRPLLQIPGFRKTPKDQAPQRNGREILQNRLFQQGRENLLEDQRLLQLRGRD